MKKRLIHSISRPFLLSLILLSATFLVIYATDLITKQVIPRTFSSDIPMIDGEMHALTVRTFSDADFPSQKGLPTNELQKQLDQLAEFAETYGYNAIFFEAVENQEAFYRSGILPKNASWVANQEQFAFFDPLGYLTNICKEKNIQVYAVINPLSIPESPAADNPAATHPEWVAVDHLNPANQDVQKWTAKIVKELTSNYDIAGVILSGVDSEKYKFLNDYSQSVNDILSQSYDAVKQSGKQRLGMVVNSSSILNTDTVDIYSAPIKNKKLDFIVASSSDVSSLQEYASELSAWESLCVQYSSGQHPISFYPLHTASTAAMDAHLIDSSLYYERLHGAAGIVISNYGLLNTADRRAAYSLAASFAQTPITNMPDLSYSQSFEITRPTETLTVSPGTSSYFITGTSDPAFPLFYEGKELERSSTSGLWGALVKVPVGNNTYTFTQNGVSKSISIVRNESTTSKIKAIVKSSVYPQSPEAVLEGQKLKLSCNAPSGGTVTATIGDLSIELTPVASASEDGVSVTYQQTIDLTSLAVTGQVKNLGPVTYQLNFQGLNSTEESPGSVYIAGANTRIVAKMKAGFVPISKNGADDGVYTTVLKEDCVVYVSENTGGAYYKLSTGDYVLKSAVEIVEGAATADNTVSFIALEDMPKGEKYRITGTCRSSFSGSMEGNTVVVRLENIAKFDRLNPSLLTQSSRLCDTIESTINDDNSVTLTFTLNDSVRLLGYEVQFDGNDTIIYLREKPVLHPKTAKPLSDITILIDPGHGGSDPGAAGVPQHLGPVENVLNMANALTLENRLTALGATVYITHRDDSITLNDRMKMAEELDVDMFISCHHNSIAETVDSNTVGGIEVYYYNSQSKAFAENIGASLSNVTGRKLRFADWSYYRVTMMTARPSVLVESGYICSPAEYENISNELSMYQYANAVADAVLEYFS